MPAWVGGPPTLHEFEPWAYDALPDFYKGFFDVQADPYTPLVMTLICVGPILVIGPFAGVYSQYQLVYADAYAASPPGTNNPVAPDLEPPPEYVPAPAPVPGYALPYSPGIDAPFPLTIGNWPGNEGDALRLIEWYVYYHSRPLYNDSAAVTWSNFPVESVDSKATVEGGMDGCLVFVSEMPGSLGYFGTVWPAYCVLHLGSVAFSLNGHMDQRQLVEFTDGIYVPKNLAMADRVDVECKPGVRFTVTSFRTSRFAA